MIAGFAQKFFPGYFLPKGRDAENREDEYEWQ